MTRLSIGHRHGPRSRKSQSPSMRSASSGLSIEDLPNEIKVQTVTGSRLAGQHPCDKSKRSAPGVGRDSVWARRPTTQTPTRNDGCRFERPTVGPLLNANVPGRRDAGQGRFQGFRVIHRASGSKPGARARSVVFRSLGVIVAPDDRMRRRGWRGRRWHARAGLIDYDRRHLDRGAFGRGDRRVGPRGFGDGPAL